MKKFLAYPLVVEGKEDASYLSNYIGSEIVVVNGFEISDAVLSYLKNKTIIALLDPDESGKQIRRLLNNKLSNVINVEIDIDKCTKGRKNGVAECEINEIINTLSPYFVDETPFIGNISNYDLYNLGILGNSELRDYVCLKLNLGKCNNKQLFKRISLNNVELDLIKRIVEDYKHGN